MRAHSLTIVTHREPNGLFTAHGGGLTYSGVSSTMAARNLAAEFFRVDPIDIALEPEAERVLRASVRPEVSPLLWWVLVSLGFGGAAVLAFFIVTGGAR